MIITVSREFASGGRSFAKQLAAKLGYPYFDKEILEKIQSHTGFSAEYIKDTVEANYSNLVFSGILQVPNGGFALKNYGSVNPGSTIMQAQREVIQSIATSYDDCIIVGRCADYILQAFNPFKIFVYSGMQTKIQRCQIMAEKYDIEGDKNLSTKKIKKYIKKINRSRSKYYKFFTGRKWSDPQNYDIMINTDFYADDNFEELFKIIGGNL